MSRFADQLPIIAEPTAANYLIATDENDPKALVRIPADGLTSNGGSTNYQIITDDDLTDSTIALTAGAYLYVGTDHANLDLSGLEDGDRIEIINHTSKQIFLFGFLNWFWNGLAVALQETKGLIIEKAGIIAVKHSDNLYLFNTVANLRQDSRVGFIPATIALNYVSPGDTNGIIYYLGATKYNASFVNPHTRGEITATASSVQDGNRTADKAFTRGNSGQNGCWHSTQTNGGWLRTQFANNKKAIVTSFELWSSSGHALSTYMGANCLFQASDDGTNWTTLLTFFPNVAANIRYYSGEFTNSNRYSYYRFYSPTNFFHVIGDIELYGEMET